MRIQRWCLGGLFALLAVVDHGLIANAAGKPGRKLVRANKPSSRSIARMIAGLDSKRYIVRRKAARDLMRRGSAAVAPLAKAARNGSWEVRVRSIVILEVIYTSPDSDDQTVERIEELLETLRATGRAGAAGRAAEVLDRNDDFRERRALIAIKRLGGIIEYLDSARTIRNFPPVPNTAGLGQRRLNFVLLGRKWKGGDEGLKYIKRLPGLRNLYIAESKKFQPVSQKARRQLQTAMPNLTIQERGLACLGVSGSPTNANGIGCYVQTVKPGSAAAQGKIRPSDYITHFAGKKVSSFQVMVKLIAEHDPGDKVSVVVNRVVNRRMQTLTLSIVLGEWTAK